LVYWLFRTKQDRYVQYERHIAKIHMDVRRESSLDQIPTLAPPNELSGDISAFEVVPFLTILCR
jgi:hypothetical protein